jgi:hypothetical protein
VCVHWADFFFEEGTVQVFQRVLEERGGGFCVGEEGRDGKGAGRKTGRVAVLGKYLGADACMQPTSEWLALCGRFLSDSGGSEDTACASRPDQNQHKCPIEGTKYMESDIKKI